jgi:hypothetical protein
LEHELASEVTTWFRTLALTFALSACVRDPAQASPASGPSVVASSQALKASAAPLASQSTEQPAATPTPTPTSTPSALPAARSAGALTFETRHVRDSRPAKQPSPGVDARSCSVDAEYPAIRGLGGAVEARINALLAPKRPLLQPDCEVATSYEIRYHVVLNEAGYLSVVFDHNFCCGAHPAYSKHFVNVNTGDGKSLTFATLFRAGAAKAVSAQLVPQVRQALVDDPNPSEEWLAELSQDPSQFWLERGGLRISLFNAAPHAIQAAFEDGFFFSCQKLAEFARRPGPFAGYCSTK